MNSQENLLNQIELLKQALIFYANNENYLFYKNKDALITIDEGSQARFALKKLKETLDVNQKMEDEYIKNLTENTTPKGVINLINEIKKIDGSKI